MKVMSWSKSNHTCCNREWVRKGLWSPEEDEKLLNYITTFGHACWTSIPRYAGLQRCGKSCRLRWINYLRPDLKRGSFTPQEAAIVIELHRLVGNKWSQIAQHLPGRTDNEVKNFWNSSLKKKIVAHHHHHMKHKNMIANSGADALLAKSSSSSSESCPNTMINPNSARNGSVSINPQTRNILSMDPAIPPPTPLHFSGSAPRADHQMCNRNAIPIAPPVPPPSPSPLPEQFPDPPVSWPDTDPSPQILTQSHSQADVMIQYDNFIFDLDDPNPMLLGDNNDSIFELNPEDHHAQAAAYNNPEDISSLDPYDPMLPTEFEETMKVTGFDQFPAAVLSEQADVNDPPPHHIDYIISRMKSFVESTPPSSSCGASSTRPNPDYTLPSSGPFVWKPAMTTLGSSWAGSAVMY